MDHPQHCQHLAEQITTETDEAERERLRDRFRDECQDDPVTLEEPAVSALDSGPTSPAPPPPPKKGG
ncbi:hypothetical protein [Sphingomonas sp. Marseille-Q8236]